MRILVVQDADWVEKGPHQQHHLFERLELKGHSIRIVDYETSWKRNRIRGVIARRRECVSSGKVMKQARIRVIRPTMIRLPVLCYISVLFFHYREIRRQMRNFRPDIVVGWGILGSLMAAIIARSLSVPFLYYVIDSLHTLIREKQFRVLGRILERTVARSARVVFVINKGLAEYVGRMGVHPGRIKLLTAGIDHRRMNLGLDGRAVRERYGFRNDDVVLFFMGTMFSFSGLKEVTRSLIGSGPDTERIRLLLLGRGDLFDELLVLSKTPEAAGRITLVSWLPYDQVPLHIAAADFCLLPAHVNAVMRDIVPIKTYEYLACGKPVLATKLPGIIKEFGIGNGIVYVDSPDKIISKARELMRSPERIVEIGLNGYRFVSALGWPDLTDQFEFLLEEQCGGSV